MSTPGCASCRLRAKYDSDPKSFIGKLWKFHIKFCPGWKMYIRSLSDDDRKLIFEKYGERKI